MILALWAQTARGQARQPLAAAVDSLAARFLADTSRHDLAVGILRPGRDETYYYGRAHRTGTRPIDAGSLFEVGSVTKLYTAFMLANLEYDGKLRRDDYLADHLPANLGSGQRWARQITLRQLVTHTSGLPPYESTRALMTLPGFDENDPYRVIDSAFVFRALATVDSLPGRGQVKYSNLGMTLLAYAMQHRGRASYDHLLTRYVRRPLKLRDLYLQVPPAAQARIAVPHRGSEVMPLIQLHAFTPAGGIKTTLPELLSFLRAHLRPSSARLRWVAANSLQDQLTPPAEPVGLGWGIHTIEGETVYFHNGGTYGSSSVVLIVPSKNVGVALLANTATNELNNHAIALAKQLIRQPQASAQNRTGKPSRSTP
jgi:CubicO group peptidase (beta-lactamase class C family)